MSNGNGYPTRSAQNGSAEGSPKERSKGGRPSFELPSSPTTPQSARIRKQRATPEPQAGPRTRVTSITSPIDGSKSSLSNSSTVKGTARKSSLRNVVRRIFGRKVRTPETQIQQPVTKRSPPRHGYTTSDPGALRPIPEQPATAPSTEASIPQRTLSAPLKLQDPPGFRRARSPYAVEFPQSSRLKPLDLGNPFHKQNSQELKRRATLPSLIMDKDEAAALAKAIQIRSEDLSPEPQSRTLDSDDEIGLAVSTPTRRQYRRSRSADDLRRMAMSLQPVRPRQDEIQFWRQSTAGSVLRHSVQPLDTRNLVADRYGDVSPISAQGDDPFVTSKDPNSAVGAGKVSPIHDSPVRSRPATATGDSAGDIEARVVRLENGLATFQNALERLTAQSNRRTIIIDNTTSARGSRQNTPSILVNSLLDAEYRYSNYTSSGRDAYTTSAPRDAPPADARATGGRYEESGQAQPRSVSALYTILHHERTARRTLEHQVRDLQSSVEEMRYELSQPIIRRPSPAYGSMSRHSSAQRGPSYQSHPQQQYSQQAGQVYGQHSGQEYSQSSGVNHVGHQERYSETSGIQHPGVRENRLTSRFSLSDSLTDSEAARLREARDAEEVDDGTKSFDLYQTPAEEQRQRSSGMVSDGGMF